METFYLISGILAVGFLAAYFGFHFYKDRIARRVWPEVAERCGLTFDGRGDIYDGKPFVTGEIRGFEVLARHPYNGKGASFLSLSVTIPSEEQDLYVGRSTAGIVGRPKKTGDPRFDKKFKVVSALPQQEFLMLLSDEVRGLVLESEAGRFGSLTGATVVVSRQQPKSAEDAMALIEYGVRLAEAYDRGHQALAEYLASRVKEVAPESPADRQGEGW